MSAPTGSPGPHAARVGSATVFAQPDALANAAAELVLQQLGLRLQSAPRCSLALSGGSTPTATYAALAKSSFPWERVDFYFADERCVPPEHADSNFAGANKTLFQPLNAKASQIFRMRGELPDVDQAAREYERSLPSQLNVVVLGIGEDGHTCSLFPGHPQLQEKTRRVVGVSDSPKPPPLRLTLTPPALQGAFLLMLVTGAGKANAVRLALEESGPASEIPARLARQGTWYLDAAAAEQLKGTGKANG